jgi:acyl carrier protein
VAIGKPISNTQVYLLDRHSQAVPIGIPGEIYVGGDGLARGYLNRRELTAQRFVANWLAPDLSPRLYRTGDLGRWRHDGDIEYLGRVDLQIKLRGMRIELGEIESALASHPAVKQAVVIVKGEAEQQKLSAFVIVKSADAIPSAPELRRHVRTKLPEHMVPAEYCQVNLVPLLPSGKVNRAALAQDGNRPLPEGQSVAPRNDTETQLAAIWGELLRVQSVGTDQNFFELGGHSLLVLQMTARIRRSLEVELPARAVFEAPTIAALAQQVERARASGMSVRIPELKRRQPGATETSREQLLAQLDSMSPDELQSVLQRVLGVKPPAGEGAAD